MGRNKITPKNRTAEETKSGNSVSIKRFALTYLVLMGAFFFIIGYTPLQKIIDVNGAYTKGVVLVTAKILGILSIPCVVHNSVLQLPAISLDVKFGCNGLEAVMIYSVAIAAFPSTWKKRFLGILAGFVVLQIINVFRIAGLAYAGIHFRGLFEYIHIYVAQGLMIAVSLGLFFIYLRYAKPDAAAS
jgi:exosortase/archaeosortase family protein